MRQTYYACIIKKKKKKLTQLSIPSLKFQNLHFYNKENSSEKFSDLYLMKIQISFELKK